MTGSGASAARCACRLGLRPCLRGGSSRRKEGGGRRGGRCGGRRGGRRCLRCGGLGPALLRDSFPLCERQSLLGRALRRRRPLQGCRPLLHRRALRCLCSLGRRSALLGCLLLLGFRRGTDALLQRHRRRRGISRRTGISRRLVRHCGRRCRSRQRRRRSRRCGDDPPWRLARMGVDLRRRLHGRRPQYWYQHRLARIALLQLEQNAVSLPPRLSKPAAARGLLTRVDQRGQLTQRLAERLGGIVEYVELIHGRNPHDGAGVNADAGGRDPFALRAANKYGRGRTWGSVW